MDEAIKIERNLRNNRTRPDHNYLNPLNLNYPDLLDIDYNGISLEENHPNPLIRRWLSKCSNKNKF